MSTATPPNNNLQPWYLIGILHAELLQHGEITSDAWNRIMWDTSNATRFQR
jgi:hypothetical protein